VKRHYRMPFGAERRDGATHFRLWAPSASRVELVAEPPGGPTFTADLKGEKGWYELASKSLGAGTRYRYRIDGELDVPDPASRFNPEGVDGPSEVVDPEAFEWSDDEWRGRPWREAVLYELHVGTFTPEGTLAAVVPRLADLAATGITAIELMPLASFPGQRGWGYDGILQYAPHPAYGTPPDLKALVQAAHQHGIMVLLDVVYNHFGPQGNYLHRYAQPFFTERHQTPWGAAIDFAVPEVRQFFIQNALYWIEEYHLDGLRVDAVHAMFDDRSPHFIEELIDAVQKGPARERYVHIVLENHHNESHLLAYRGRSRSTGKQSTFVDSSAVAQWNDDFHHPLHVILTGETDGYYEDFAAEPHAMLGRVLAEGFAFQGEKSSFGDNLPRGEPSAHLPPAVFVNFLQTHDQIGNRAFGERLAELAEPDPLRAAYAVLLLAPQTPMLVMGEEYAAIQPFLYFCDYEGELAEAITSGRRKEFAKFRLFSDEQSLQRIPNPNDGRTFLDSKLDWSDRKKPLHREWLSYVTELLKVRRERVLPLVDRIEPGRSRYQVAEGVVTVDWPTGDGKCLTLVANLRPTAAASLKGECDILFTTSREVPADGHMSAWEVRLLARAFA
jgi:maltooligosyltrehalose trehalohydrolase